MIQKMQSAPERAKLLDDTSICYTSPSSPIFERRRQQCKSGPPKASMNVRNGFVQIEQKEFEP